MTIPDGYQRDGDISGRIFNILVSSMEFLNDQNIAVQALRTTPRNFNPNIRSFDDSIKTDGNGNPHITYTTFFLNPENMLLQQTDMWPEEDSSAAELGQGLLCPSQRRTPNFG